MNLKFVFLLLALSFTLATSTFAQNKINGSIKDVKAERLPFVSVYVKGTTYGTLTNETGDFYLNLAKGKHTLIVQYIGYVSQEKEITVSGDMRDVDFILQEETLNISEVVVNAGEDPAIPIIKKAIKNRSKYNKNPYPFKSDLYIKGLVKLIDVPKKFMGQDIGSMDGILDTTRQGIVYFSESLSNVFYSPPNDYKEEMVSSKVSGSDKEFSVNQFRYSNFNFYDQYVGLFREIISPIADVALQHYNYYLYDTFKDKNGYTIHKIKVKPKSKFTPCVVGFIYITEELYNIQSLDFILKGDALKNKVIDSIDIKQIFVPSTKDKDHWNLITQTVSFGLKIFLFKAKGNFNYIFKNYDYNHKFEKGFFNNEIFSVTEEAIKNNETFWKENRPIDLTVEESTDYIKKDSIAKVTSSPAYQDSVDRVGNKFRPSNILFGYSYSNSKKKINWGVSNPITSIMFNAVEGTRFGIKPYWKKDNEYDFDKITLFGEFNYGLADKRLKWKVNYNNNFNIKSLGSYSFTMGDYYYQYNEDGIASEFSNSLTSLIYKINPIKLFRKQFLKFRVSNEVVNGVILSLTSEIAKRRSMDNNSEYSYFNKDKSYEANHPFYKTKVDYDFEDNIFKNTFAIRWSPDQKYQSFPSHRNRFKSDWPMITASLDWAIPLNNSYANFSKVKCEIIDEYVSAKRLGYLKYKVSFGKFLSNEKISAVDYFHTRGINLLSSYESVYLNIFKLQEGYDLSTTQPYAAMWFEHYFDGFFNDRIPLLNNLGITGIWSVSTFQQKGKNYIEPGIGIEGIKIGAIDVMRLDYYFGFLNGKLNDQGFRIGFSSFFENILGR